MPVSNALLDDAVRNQVMPRCQPPQRPALPLLSQALLTPTPLVITKLPFLPVFHSPLMLKGMALTPLIGENV